KNLFNAAILGKAPVEDTKLRDERDATDGVERLMKENWDQVTQGSEEDVWVMHIDFVDFRYLDTHRNITRLTREHQKAGKKGMDHFRFARVDYMREAEICTRWLIFSSPILVFVSDQGKTLRFAPKNLVGAGGDFVFEIMESGEWTRIPVWKSRYAPGGDRAHIVEFYLKSSDFVYAQSAKVPTLVWMGMFAAITQGFVKWMH
ncbi:uncharacterized protein MKK02DRAFT_6909, partial [Dioszegia hungarica]